MVVATLCPADPIRAVHERAVSRNMNIGGGGAQGVADRGSEDPRVVGRQSGVRCKLGQLGRGLFITQCTVFGTGRQSNGN